MLTNSISDQEYRLGSACHGVRASSLEMVIDFNVLYYKLCSTASLLACLLICTSIVYTHNSNSNMIANVYLGTSSL